MGFASSSSSAPNVTLEPGGVVVRVGARVCGVDRATYEEDAEEDEQRPTHVSDLVEGRPPCRPPVGGGEAPEDGRHNHPERNHERPPRQRNASASAVIEGAEVHEEVERKEEQTHDRGDGRHGHREREVGVEEAAPPVGVRAARRAAHDQQRDGGREGRPEDGDGGERQEREEHELAHEAACDAAGALEVVRDGRRVDAAAHAEDEQEEQTERAHCLGAHGVRRGRESTSRGTSRPNWARGRW